MISVQRNKLSVLFNVYSRLPHPSRPHEFQGKICYAVKRPLLRSPCRLASDDEGLFRNSYCLVLSESKLTPVLTTKTSLNACN